MASDNRTLARFRLEGIPPAPAGVPQIEVTFDIDANGIVSATAKDLGTGKEQRITITASTNLSKEEVERMVRDAQAHAEEDRRKREEAEIRNQAMTLINATERSLKEVGERLEPAVRSEVDSALADLRRVSENGTTEEIKPAVDRLQQASYKMSEVLYQRTAAGGGDGDAAQRERQRTTTTGETSSAPSDDVIDAEYKESK
jgi:molecular chaperone DnaK